MIGLDGLDVFDDAGGHSRHYGEGRNGGSDHGSGCHHGMPSDGDSRQNDRMRSYPHVIVDHNRFNHLSTLLAHRFVNI